MNFIIQRKIPEKKIPSQTNMIPVKMSSTIPKFRSSDAVTSANIPPNFSQDQLSNGISPDYDISWFPDSVMSAKFGEEIVTNYQPDTEPIESEEHLTDHALQAPNISSASSFSDGGNNFHGRFPAHDDKLSDPQQLSRVLPESPAFYNSVSHMHHPSSLIPNSSSPDYYFQHNISLISKNNGYSPIYAYLKSNTSLSSNYSSYSYDLPFFSSNYSPNSADYTAQPANFSAYSSDQTTESTDLTPLSAMIWTVLLGSVLVVGLLGNLLVPVVVLRTRDLRTSTNFLLVNLAMADVLVLAVCLPTALIELHTSPNLWILGEPLCKIVPFVEWCVSHASVLTILVIGLERYYAICRPLTASYTCTKMRACSCIITIWVTTLIVSSPMLLISRLHELKIPETSPSFPASTVSSSTIFPASTSLPSAAVPSNFAIAFNTSSTSQPATFKNFSIKHLSQATSEQVPFASTTMNLFSPEETVASGNDTPLTSYEDNFPSTAAPAAAYTCYTSMESRWANFYYISMVLLFFLGPLVMLLLLYLIIAQRLVRDTTSAQLHRKSELPNMRARKQVVVMLATVSVFFFVSLLPFRVLSLWMIFDFDTFRKIEPSMFLSLLYTTRLMLYLNSAINPILYNLTSTKFRDAFWKFLTRSSARDLMRRSTFTTATSLSNGRQSSARSSVTGQSPRCSLRSSINLYKQSSLANFSVQRRQLIARYGRHGSFVTSTSSGTITPTEGSNGRKETKSVEAQHSDCLDSKMDLESGEYTTRDMPSFCNIAGLPTLTEMSCGTPSTSPHRENVVMNFLNLSKYRMCEQRDSYETEMQV